ncbi:heavy-metal-associated domain-containing protein [Eggerthellaceae bacterium PR-HUZ602407-17]|jgi:hypothetical protein
MKRVIRLDGELCPNCGSKIEETLKKSPLIEDCKVNALSMRFTLEAQDDKYEEAYALAKKTFNAIEPDCTFRA